LRVWPTAQKPFVILVHGRRLLLPVAGDIHECVVTVLRIII